MAADYETMIVLSSKLGEEESKTLLGKFTTLISENAELGTVDEWGKRRLAYEIQKENDGYYYLVNFKSEPDFLKELDRVYNITDGVLRTIIVRKEA